MHESPGRRGSLKAWRLIETLLVLLVANAIVWLVVAMGWPQLLPLPTVAAASRMASLDAFETFWHDVSDPPGPL